MTVHQITKGIDLPIAGAPEQRIDAGKQVQHVALLAADSLGLKPRVAVEVGELVKRGQLLYEDRAIAGVRYTAPASGKVAAIHRAARRALQSVVIEVDRADHDGGAEHFALPAGGEPDGAELRALMLSSGLWPALRTRPFSKVPDPTTSPHSLLVTAIDSEPHSPTVDVVLEGRTEQFALGLRALTRLTEGTTYLCVHASSTIDAGDSGAETVRFDGVHPAGSVGLHIHLLDPAHRGRTVWHIGYQDVLALGGLLATGELDAERVVSLAGPAVRAPRLLRTTLGASVDELVRDELADDAARVLSGSVLTGRHASGPALGYLGRYHRQVSALREGRERELLGWLRPGRDKFSILPAFISAFLGGGRRFELSTSSHGGRRAMVPIGMYERVMPFDLMPTHLLRALVVGDAEWAEELGCLELDEEDLALCSFVCPGKVDYGPHLRKVLDMLEADG